MSPVALSAEERWLRLQVKRELRKRMKMVRGAVPESARAQRANAIQRALVEMPEFESARVVAAYCSVRDEVDTSEVVRRVWAENKTVAYPRVDGERLVLHEVTPDTVLSLGSYDVPEPPASAPTVAESDIDFIIVPALAVEPNGHRIGYGGGFFDRLLPTLPQAFRCAVVYDFQLISEVPTLPTDVPVHAIVTDAQVIRCGDSA